MADSPPRTDPPDPHGGGAHPGGFATAPSPWGDSVPWWTADGRQGTGPQPVADPSGPHARPAPPDGSGPLPVQPGGTGPLPVQPGGSGAHRLPDGTGPLPPVPSGRSARRKGTGMLLGAGAGAVLLMVLVAGVLLLRSGDATGETAGTQAPPESFQSSRTVTVGESAGGLPRDPTPPEMSAAYPFVTGGVRAGGLPAAENGVAVYATGKISVLFAGGTGRVGDPAEFLRKTRPSTFITGQSADPGEAGGKAFCGRFAVLADVHTYCAWATADSYGVVASNLASLQPRYALLNDVMRRVRADVEELR